MGPSRLLTLGLSPAPVLLSAVEHLDVLSLLLSGTRLDKLAKRLLVDWGGGGRSSGCLGKEGIRNARQDFRTHWDSPWTASKDLLLPIISRLREFKRLQVVPHCQTGIGLVTGDWRGHSKLRVTPHPHPEQIIAARK